MDEYDTSLTRAAPPPLAGRGSARRVWEKFKKSSHGDASKGHASPVAWKNFWRQLRSHGLPSAFWLQHRAALPIEELFATQLPEDYPTVATTIALD